VLAWLALASLQAEAAALSKNELTVTHEDLAQIRPKGDVPRERFDKDLGQFEVRIPKERFPIPAPNCRSEVILRMPGVVSPSTDKQAELQRRWILFRALVRVQSREQKSERLPLASGPYMTGTSSGKRTLEYCNAYIDVKALRGH